MYVKHTLKISCLYLIYFLKYRPKCKIRCYFLPFAQTILENIVATLTALPAKSLKIFPLPPYAMLIMYLSSSDPPENTTLVDGGWGSHGGREAYAFNVNNIVQS
jgi:hypothetical protein